MRNNERGFTLVEVLLVIAVSGMIVATVTSSILLVFKVPARSTAAVAATENIRHAAYRISRDIKMAGTTNLVDGAQPVENFTLDWISWYEEDGVPDDTYYRVKYWLSAGKLKRRYGSYDPGATTPTQPILDSSFTWQTTEAGSPVVGQYITSIQFSSEALSSGKRVLVTIASNLGGASGVVESATYRLYLQAKEETPYQ